MHHLLAIAFDTPASADDGLRELLRAPVETDSALADACLASRDPAGSLRVEPASPRPPRILTDATLRQLASALATGQALDWAALRVPAAFADQVAGSLEPGRSVLLAVTDGPGLDLLLTRLGHLGRAMRCDLGDDGRDALRQRFASALPDPERADAEGAAGHQAAFGSFP
jgi:hypothetical protein